jgi:4-amino-4-deoxy-L-arabinose transferase-like glycosyltransferase
MDSVTRFETVENAPTHYPAPLREKPGFPGREALLLILLVALGLGLRIWKLSGAEIDHYDEAVYAFSGLGLADHTQPYVFYPDQIKFSPPVFPVLVSLAFRIGGPAGFAANLLNAVLGTFSILAIWWVARRWFGPPAALAAAALLTCSTYHIVFSRTVLTDICFALIFLIAMAAAELALRRDSLWVAIIAGLSTGLAWNTKYHGWFVLLIVAGTLLLAQWRQLLSLTWTRECRRMWLLWAVMTVTASICYLPWLWFIQSQPGGYVALAKYQRTMLSLHYLTNLWLQARQQFLWETPLSRLSIPMAVLSAIFVSGKPVLSRRVVLCLGAVTAVGLLAGSWAAAALMALLAIPSLYGNAGSWSARMLVVWLAIWFLATPVYRPYSRLLLPFTIATFLAAGYWVSVTLQQRAKSAAAGRLTILAVAVPIALSLMVVFRLPAADPWRPTREFASAAREMAAIIPPGSRVCAIGEPGLAFYLHLSGRPASERCETFASLAHLSEPVYVIAGLYARLAPELTLTLQKLGPRLERLASFEPTPGQVRLLDDFPSGNEWRATGHSGNPYELTLFRLLPE